MMKAGGRQLLGLVLAIIGFLGSIISCALPLWKFINWRKLQGLWKYCVFDYEHYLTETQWCKAYESVLGIPTELQAARVLVVIAIIAGIFGVMVGVVGGNCGTFVSAGRKKSKEAIASGIVFIFAGILLLIPVCWTTITITREFYYAWERMGASLYIGWASAGLLLLGGSLLCCSCPRRNEIDFKVEYSKPSSV
ncbi:claudin-4-like [Archocentrus centrarchus]|uniref:claudin-4-like n=1 Tax=Archocentrus centrarchus TaxID=63155 RepID=UPI0011EA07B5|nr:claudin-4-like [Archocentrus centrarchus]